MDRVDKFQFFLLLVMIVCFVLWLLLPNHISRFNRSLPRLRILPRPVQPQSTPDPGGRRGHSVVASVGSLRGHHTEIRAKAEKGEKRGKKKMRCDIKPLAHCTENLPGIRALV
jgi:hypothetical protein